VRVQHPVLNVTADDHVVCGAIPPFPSHAGAARYKIKPRGTLHYLHYLASIILQGSRTQLTGVHKSRDEHAHNAERGLTPTHSNQLNYLPADRPVAGVRVRATFAEDQWVLERNNESGSKRYQRTACSR